ncbi:UDP-glycosyltransferase UGT5 isoform X2 [Cherax quadricarinatus]|uniref:UDP-glycosyltransferase UGT5 isoform X2 n=1 Tax=Cherax quadricarinatus TaxID=27406 RepID=UPI00387ED251
MRWWCWMLAVMLVLVSVKEMDSANILFLAPFGTISHKNFFMSIAEALAERNHTVTFVAGHQASNSRRRIKEVFVADTNIFSEFSSTFVRNQFSSFMKMFSMSPEYCGKILRSQELQEVQEEKFDLVMLGIVLSECFYSLINKLQVPYIHMTPNTLHESMSDLAGNPQFPSMVGNYLLDLGYPLTFTDRIKNIFSQMVYSVINMHYAIPSVEMLEVPVRPYVPTVIHAGGIHCKPAKPLPKDLEAWVAEAGDEGFIFFSLGSAFKASTMPEKYRLVLLKVFVSLKQRILWKWDQDTMDDLPPNVRLAKWLPQQDILGDPRLRLFITHGGLLSIQEATYHGIPILGMPIFVDQHHNVRQVQDEGWGRHQAWEELTYDLFLQNIHQVINDTKLRQEAVRRSVVMRDQPMSPGEWTVYWVEYVIRHRGAPHLRSPFFTMHWYEVYNVDVWLLLTGVMALVTWFFWWVILTVFSRVCSTIKHKQE